MAITKYDQFDFLIDIVPRDEIKPTRIKEEGVVRTSMNPDQVRILNFDVYIENFNFNCFRFIIISN